MNCRIVLLFVITAMFLLLASFTHAESTYLSADDYEYSLESLSIIDTFSLSVKGINNNNPFLYGDIFFYNVVGDYKIVTTLGDKKLELPIIQYWGMVLYGNLEVVKDTVDIGLLFVGKSLNLDDNLGYWDFLWSLRFYLFDAIGIYPGVRFSLFNKTTEIGNKKVFVFKYEGSSEIRELEYNLSYFLQLTVFDFEIYNSFDIEHMSFDYLSLSYTFSLPLKYGEVTPVLKYTAYQNIYSINIKASEIQLFTPILCDFYINWDVVRGDEYCLFNSVGLTIKLDILATWGLVNGSYQESLEVFNRNKFRWDVYFAIDYSFFYDTRSAPGIKIGHVFDIFSNIAVIDIGISFNYAENFLFIPIGNTFNFYIYIRGNFSKENLAEINEYTESLEKEGF